jgi:hypothetical protein
MNKVYCVHHESIFGENTREFSNLQEALDWVGVIAANDGEATLTTEIR